MVIKEVNMTTKNNIIVIINILTTMATRDGIIIPKNKMVVKKTVAQERKEVQNAKEEQREAIMVKEEAVLYL
jgi:hypothetical protein